MPGLILTDFLDAFPDEIAALPAWSDSNHSDSNPHRQLPNGSGHAHKSSIATLKSSQNLALPALNPARLSTISVATETGYILPELRVGPSGPSAAPPIVVDGSHIRSNSRDTISPLTDYAKRGIPSIQTSSPRKSTFSGDRRASVSPALTPSLGNRARSIVGSLNTRSRSSLSVQSESGNTIGEIIERDVGNDGMIIDITPAEQGTKKLGRFGSFMRRRGD